MPSRSQARLRERWGVDSAGDVSDATSSSVSGNTILADEGTQTVPAEFTVMQTLADGNRVTVSLTADALAPDTFFVDADAGDLTPGAVAEALRALINADPQYAATRVSNRVSVLAVDPILTVTLNSIVVAPTP